MMSRKKTPEDYHKLAKSKGSAWLGPVVPNAQTKTRWQCARGHVRITAFGNFRRWGCSHCSGKARKISENYEELAIEKGLKWLGPEVDNVYTKTQWECLICGYHWWTKYHSLAHQKGCPQCAGKALKMPSDYEELGKENNLDWLGPFPSHTHKKTKWRCSFGHIWAAPFNRIKQKHGCPYCAKVAPKIEKDYLVLAQKMGLQWKGPMVDQVITKTQWLCKQQHLFMACYSSVQKGTGCPICAGNKPKTAIHYEKLATKRGLKWHGPMVPNTGTKTVWQCGENSSHHWEAPYSNIINGSGCPHCDRKAQSERSKALWISGKMDNVFQSPTSIELETAEALDDLGIRHISQYRPDGYSRIYDEFIPPDILLELHGDYWHGSERPEQQKQDIEKAQWAKDNDFIPIVFWEHEIKTHGAKQLIRERILPLLSD